MPGTAKEEWALSVIVDHGGGAILLTIFLTDILKIRKSHVNGRVKKLTLVFLQDWNSLVKM
jgi:hypothetical protein